jgi:CRP/FNR family cyclic AMP-dependent transcriptional regulator
MNYLSDSGFRPAQDDPHKYLALIAYGRTTTDVSKDTEIFAQGAPARHVYFIQSGRVRVTVTNEMGKQATVAILKDDQFFGESCLGKQTARISTTTAITCCRITRIEVAAMNEALQLQPAFSKFFMDHLLSRNSRIEADVVDQLFNSSEKRLARHLLLLAHYGKEGSPPIIPVTISQEILAEMIGTTRPRVSHFMNRFREKGLIDYDGRTIIVHVSLLNSVLRDRANIAEGADPQP